MQITIIGAGNMGRGIAARAAAGGHSVHLVDRHREKADQVAGELREQVPDATVEALAAEEAAGGVDAAVAASDVVVLALKYPGTLDIAKNHAAALAGKVVVDIANPADFTTFDPTTPAGTSAAEQLAETIPDASVVKAFNTTFAGPLRAGELEGRPLDVFVAADDAGAKSTVADLVTSAGLRPVDAGPLRRSRALEAFQILHMSLQKAMPKPFGGAIALVG